MKDNYINLCTFEFGKYSYSIIRNNDKIMYFESTNGDYMMPIASFSLFDNEGKSLTNVNQHFFVSQLIDRINAACKKGIFVGDDEVVEYLNNLKLKTENDSELKKLFKGSLMKEIDEENFEENKKNILNYLDKFRVDTFVNYNNVSYFNGPLEKTDVQVTDSIVEVEPTEVDIVDDNQELVLDEAISSIDSQDLTDVDDTVSADEFFKDSSNVQKVEELNNELVYGSSVSSNSPSESADVVDYNVSNKQESSKSEIVQDELNVGENDLSNTQSNNFSEQQNFGVSYLEEVKERIESKNLNISNNNDYNSEIGILNTSMDELELNKTFVSDKPVLPELESVTDESVTEEIVEEVKKSNFGIVIFIIVLVILLILFTFFLYNYVF